MQEAQKHLAAHDPIMATLIEKYENCTLTPHTNYYQELVKAIISQQLSVKAGQAIFNRLLELFHNTMPTPAQILRTDIEDLRKVGCSYAKISYLMDLAARLEDGRLDLDQLASRSGDEVIKELTDVNGIGEWTAQMFMIFSLGRTNILPTGDLGICNAMRRLYRLNNTKPAELMRISQQYSWAPYQSVAAWYLWRSLENI